MRRLRGLFLIISVLCLGTATGLLAEDKSGAIPLLDQLEYLEDPGGTITLDDVMSTREPWSHEPRNAWNFGFTKSVFWFRFQLPSTLIGQDNLVLLFQYGLLDDIAFHMPTAEGTPKVFHTGRNYPFAQRTLQTRDLAFEIPLAAQVEHRYYYLRIRTDSSAQFPMELLSFRDYFKKSYSSTLSYRIFMGAMAIMIIYNLIFCLVTRSLSYLFYVFFITGSTLFNMSLYGLSYEYLWPASVAFNKISIPFFLSFGNFSLLVFNLLSLGNIVQTRIYRTLMIANALVAGGITLCCFVLPYVICIKLAACSAMFSAFLLPIMYIALCRKRYRPAYFYLLSIGALALGTVLYGLKAFGILTYNFLPETIGMLSISSQICLLTFAMADQSRGIEKQNEAIRENMINLQQEHIKILDHKVEERTQDVRVILSSIQQGIFTISGQPPRIDEEYSEHLESMFPHEIIAGSDPLRLLVSSVPMSDDEKDQLSSAIICSLDSHSVNFDLNESLFPKQLVMQGAFQERRVLQVEWSPVVRSDATISKILVALRDVTRLLELEEEKTRIDAGFSMMTLVLSQPLPRLQSFLDLNRRILGRIEVNLADERLWTSNHLNIKGLLHTLKGNARTFGLKAMANVCHQLENLLNASSGLRIAAETEAIASCLAAIKTDLDQLEEVTLRVYAAESLNQKQHLMAIDAALQELRTPQPLKAVHHLAPLLWRQLDEVVTSLMPSLEILSKELGKDPPQLVYQQSGTVFMDAAVAELLQSALIHIFTNALIHGIENREERTRLGKMDPGCIKVMVGILDDAVVIRIEDDGRGLGLEKIRKRAVKAGLITAQETNRERIGQTIFASGLSTAHQISLHAGRGEGLSAVISILAEISATIRIEFPESAQALKTEFLPFSMCMDVPLADDKLVNRLLPLEHAGAFLPSNLPKTS